MKVGYKKNVATHQREPECAEYLMTNVNSVEMINVGLVTGTLHVTPAASDMSQY